MATKGELFQVDYLSFECCCRRSVSNFLDTFSVATIDYGYSKAYGMGGGDSVVSTSGGTFGSGTHGGQTMLGDLNPTGATASASSLLEDGLLGENATTKDVLFEIYAPPGKLGV